jgi:serine protease
MKSFLSIICTALLLFGAEGIAADFKVKPLNTTKGKPIFIEDEMLVKFHPKIPPHAIARFNQIHGATIITNLPFGISRLKIPKGKSPETMAALYRKNPNVQMAHPNYITYAAMTPNDEYFNPWQWNFDNSVNRGLSMIDVWDISNAGEGTIVAVIDTGIAYENYGLYVMAPDFSSKQFVQGYDFINDDTHPNDDHGHGTHVAGTIAQSTNDSYGTAGIAFNTALMPLKVLNAEGIGSMVEMIEAFNYIVHGPDNMPDSGDEIDVNVINMSLSFGLYDINDTVLNAAIEAAYMKGIVIVAASGNDAATDFVSHPANHPYVIAVGATDFYKNVTAYSNKGPELELTAPGGSGIVFITEGDYVTLDAILQQSFYSDDPTFFDWFWFVGTSMATPHVSATAALVKEANPNLLAAEIRTILQETAEDRGVVGRDASYGYGMVNPYDAIQQPISENKAPILVSVNIPTDGLEDTMLSFSATAIDEDGDDLFYQWDIDGLTYDGSNVTHTFAWGGNFNVTLRVDDLKGGVATDQQTVSVVEVNDEPLLVHNGPYSALSGENITFDASGTTDYDNEDGSSSNNQVLTYNWDFGDGAVTTGVQPEHSYTAKGTYNVTLSVNDTVDTVTKTTTATISANEPSSIDAPTGLIVVSVDGSTVNLSWSDNSDNEAGFKIERAKKIRGKYNFDTAENPVGDTDANVSTFSDTVTELGTYKYHVYAYYGEVVSYSNDVLVKVEESTPPPSGDLTPPSDLTAVLNSSTVTLNWQDNSGEDEEDGFYVERAEKILGKYTYERLEDPVGMNITTLYINEPTSGTFNYRVQAYKGSEVSDDSNVATVRVK